MAKAQTHAAPPTDGESPRRLLQRPDVALDRMVAAANAAGRPDVAQWLLTDHPLTNWRTPFTRGQGVALVDGREGTVVSTVGSFWPPGGIPATVDVRVDGQVLMTRLSTRGLATIK